MPTDIDTLVTIALAAGREIMAVYADPAFAHSLKADDSPVTEADIRAERVILDGLSKLAPDVPVVAEEQAASGLVTQTGHRFFLVDPLDGTREFLARNGEFTVNIALIEDGVPVAGVVHAPALGLLHAGSPDGAWKAAVDDGHRAVARHPIRTRAAPERPVAVGSRSHATGATADWLARLGVDDVVASGSSLKFCVIADGAADIYARLGPTMEWDTAAGDAVLRAAGGIVTTLDGAPLRYGLGAGQMPFANPHFVAFGDPALRGRCCSG